MPKREIEARSAAQVRDRLLQVVSDKYQGNQALFGRTYGVSHGALTQWFHRRAPAPPSVPFLLAMAKGRDRVNPAWLLCGWGTPYEPRFIKMRGTPDPQRLAARVAEQDAVIAQLRETLLTKPKKPKRKKTPTPRKTRGRRSPKPRRRR